MDESTFNTTRIRGWIERMKAGDPEAKNEFARSAGRRLEHLAGKMLRSFPNVQRYFQTDDVLNSALLRLLRSVQQMEIDSTRGLFAQAACEIRRELLDLARQVASRAGREVSWPADDAGGPWEPPDRAALDADMERWSALHESVELLPADLREVVNLLYYHGWSKVDAADLLGVHEKTVSRRWTSALVALRTRVGSRGPDLG